MSTPRERSGAAPLPTSVLHVDMDAFYASVELRDNLSLEGLPVCVGGPAASRGVIAAASYEARKYGVRSAMATATARRLCPDLVLLPPDFDKYTAVSRQIMEIFRRYTPLVEPLSLDEAFLDVAGSERLFGDAVEIGRRIKADILRETGLIASVGVAPTKFLAKLASDLDKPDGFRVILPDEIRQVLDPLPVSKIYGVGPRTAERLERLGVRTVGDLARRSREEVALEFGASGTWIHDLAQGIDPRRVTPRRDEKSHGIERTFAQDVSDREELRKFLLSFCEEVAFYLRDKGLRGRTVTLKARFSDFRTVTRSKTLDFATNLGPRLYAVTRELLEKVEARPLRLLGVQVARLEDVRQPAQPTLFPLGNEPSTRADLLRTSEKLARATESLDKLRRRFGRDVVVPAALLGHARAQRADGLEATNAEDGPSTFD
jgi:DNA polymerase-4